MTDARDLDRLVDFLHDRDTACPLCGYNLRDLTAGACPECRQPLKLTVGVQDLRMAWFIAAIIPGAFSGISAFLLMLPIIIVPMTGGVPAPVFIVALDVFGWASCVVGLIIVARRVAFLRQPVARQGAIASVIWVVHLAAFAGLLWFIFR